MEESRFITDRGVFEGDKSGYLFQVVPYGSTGVELFYTDESGGIKAKDTGSGEFKPREETIHWSSME